MHSFKKSIISMVVSEGREKALVAYANLMLEEHGYEELLPLLLASKFFGEPLELLYFDCFDGDNKAVADALRCLSNNRLKEVRAMLEAPPLGISEARLALGVDKL